MQSYVKTFVKEEEGVEAMEWKQPAYSTNNRKSNQGACDGGGYLIIKIHSVK